MGHRGHDRDDRPSPGHGPHSPQGDGEIPRLDDDGRREGAHGHDLHGPGATPHHSHSPSGHEHPGAERARDELEAGAGHGKVLFLDAPSGLAGDIIIAALTDLGVPRRTVIDAVARLPVTGYHVHFGTRVRSSIVATSFEVHIDDQQPPRTFASIRALLDEARLDGGVRARARRTFERLAVAEARVHACAVDDVHFHEVGGVDAIVDVVGAAAALDYLGAELVVSPLPMGRGFVRTAHGQLPLPAPATVECLAGLETYDGGIDFEFVTPTGAAIVGAHAARSHRWPTMVPERTGWGAGAAELCDRPNVLRAVLGRPSSTSGSLDPTETHAVLEANVDDATGELAASWIDALLLAGALDVWATPVVMKKGRPGLTMSALAPIERAEAVAHAILRETTSLGVRRYGTSRIERPRRIAHVETRYGRLPVKISEGPFGPPQIKPEFDACARAAHAHGVPVREVLRAAAAAAESPPPSRGA